MVFIMLSKGFVMVSLLHLYSQNVEGELVDIETLAKITKFFHDNYEIGQYAVAINVLKNQCEEGFSPSTSTNFLQTDKNADVRTIIGAEQSPVYEGMELIAAGVQKTPYPSHSEFLLMYPPNYSPLTNLLNRRTGCVVFYTLFSPCMNTCLSGPYNIIGGLEELGAYKGIKAFVFKKIWIYDQNHTNELREKFKVIASRIPLYRCATNYCTLCGEPNTEINEACLTA